MLDLRTVRPDDVNWDFSREYDRQLAMKMVREQRPRWIISSPPFTAFTMYDFNINYPKMSEAEAQRRINEGLVHLEFVRKLYRHQIRHGRCFPT